jgi:hypothetical protein
MLIATVATGEKQAHKWGKFEKGIYMKILLKTNLKLAEVMRDGLVEQARYYGRPWGCSSTAGLFVTPTPINADFTTLNERGEMRPYWPAGDTPADQLADRWMSAIGEITSVRWETSSGNSLEFSQLDNERGIAVMYCGRRHAMSTALNAVGLTVAKLYAAVDDVGYFESASDAPWWEVGVLPRERE